MSYAWQIAGDAIADLRALEPWLQEEVLDEFERLTADPSGLRVDAGSFAVHDFERVIADAARLVFLRLYRYDAKRVLSILGIARYARLRSGPPS